MFKDQYIYKYHIKRFNINTFNRFNKLDLYISISKKPIANARGGNYVVNQQNGNAYNLESYEPDDQNNYYPEYEPDDQNIYYIDEKPMYAIYDVNKQIKTKELPTVLNTTHKNSYDYNLK